MTLLKWLHIFDNDGYVLLSDTDAMPLLRYGLIQRMRGTTMNYHLTNAGKALITAMKARTA
jgi:hypothetical protein